MNNKNLIPLILVLALGLIMGGTFIKYITPPCDDNCTSDSDNNSISNEANPAGSEIDFSSDLTSWQEEWIDYKGTDGISFKYPKFITGLGCSSKSETFFVPTKIFEDAGGQRIYIVPEYYYSDDETQTCRKHIASLDSLQKEGSHKPSQGWSITVNDIEKSDVDIMIKSIYGAGCEMESETAWIKDGINEIKLNSYKDAQGNPTSLDRTVCPTNYVYKILYSEEKKLAVSVILGQECTFWGDGYNKCFDEQIVESLDF